jgi:hypothetical protein
LYFWNSWFAFDEFFRVSIHHPNPNLGIAWSTYTVFWGVSDPLCLSSSSAFHFFWLFFSVHHLVNWDDRHLLAHAMCNGLWLLSCIAYLHSVSVDFSLGLVGGCTFICSFLGFWTSVWKLYRVQCLISPLRVKLSRRGEIAGGERRCEHSL